MRNRQRAFIREYLKDFNATRAAKAVGYSEKTAYSIGHENLSKPEIMQAIDESIMSSDEAAANITEIARGDMKDLMDITSSGFVLRLMRDGQVIPQTRLIKKIKQKVTTFLSKKEDDEDREVIETEIELYDRHAANRDILKYRGKLIDKTDITSGGKPLKTMEVTPIDYRSAIASLAPRPVEDSPTPGESESPVDGQEMG